MVREQMVAHRSTSHIQFLGPECQRPSQKTSFPTPQTIEEKNPATNFKGLPPPRSAVFTTFSRAVAMSELQQWAESAGRFAKSGEKLELQVTRFDELWYVLICYACYGYD